MAVCIPPSPGADAACDVISSAVTKLQTQQPSKFVAITGDFNHISLSATFPTFHLCFNSAPPEKIKHWICFIQTLMMHTAPLHSLLWTGQIIIWFISPQPINPSFRGKLWPKRLWGGDQRKLKKLCRGVLRIQTGMHSVSHKEVISMSWLSVWPTILTLALWKISCSNTKKISCIFYQWLQTCCPNIPHHESPGETFIGPPE